jgi:hypothetical protein
MEHCAGGEEESESDGLNQLFNICCIPEDAVGQSWYFKLSMLPSIN